MRRQIDRSMMEAALVGYQAQHAQLTAKIAEIRRMLGKSAASNAGGHVPMLLTGKRTMSAAARKRIAAAQRKRWAAYKKAKQAK